MDIRRTNIRRPFQLRRWRRISNEPGQQAEFPNGADIEKRLDVIGLSPEEIFEKILIADEEMYTKNDFKELVQITPKNKTILEPLVNLPVVQLNRHEKIAVLLSRISCLREKVQLMSMKRSIGLALHHMKIILGWAIRASKIIQRKDFFFVVTLINQIAAEESIILPPFRFRALPIKSIDGNMFMDNIAGAVLSSDYDYTAFARDTEFSDRARHVPQISKMRQILQVMQTDVSKMEPIMRNVAKVPSHPRDTFLNVMRIFIAETKNNIKALFGMTHILETEFKSLCSLYSIPETDMQIGDLFDEAVILTRMFRRSAQRVQQERSSDRSSIYSTNRSSILSSN